MKEKSSTCDEWFIQNETKTANEKLPKFGLHSTQIRQASSWPSHMAKLNLKRFESPDTFGVHLALSGAIKNVKPNCFL